MTKQGQMDLFANARPVLPPPSRVPSLFYLLGAPGSGKSTLFAEATDPILGNNYEHVDFAVPYISYGFRVFQIGRERPTFSGTDALAMDAQFNVLSWLQELRNTRSVDIIAEGDRLANEKFFLAVKQLGYNLTVAFLNCPFETLQARWLKDSREQDWTWLKGRMTKVDRLASVWVGFDWMLDGTQPLNHLVGQLWTHPVFQPFVTAFNRPKKKEINDQRLQAL